MRAVLRGDVRDRRGRRKGKGDGKGEVVEIVCWNRVVDQQEAEDLLQRSNEDVMDADSGPLRPISVGEMEEEEFQASAHNTIQGREDDVSREVVSDDVCCKTSQDFMRCLARCDEFQTNTLSGIRDRRKEEDALSTTTDTPCTTFRNFSSPHSARFHEEFRFPSPSGVREGAEVVNAISRSDTSSPSFPSGSTTRADLQRDAHSVGKRQKYDDIGIKSFTSLMMVPPITIGIRPVIETTFTNYTHGRQLMTIPSPPIDQQRYAKPWRLCNVDQLQFNQIECITSDDQGQAQSAADRALTRYGCCADIRLFPVSDLSVSKMRSHSTQYYDLPEFNAEEVEDILQYSNER